MTPKERSKSRGRPREYEEGKGAPRFALRLPPELLTWVKESGGSSFVRQLLTAEYERRQGEARTCARCGQAVTHDDEWVEIARRRLGEKTYHLDCALPILSSD